ncbi:MAG: hypothetical protein V1889_01315 [archaeon]
MVGGKRQMVGSRSKLGQQEIVGFVLIVVLVVVGLMVYLVISLKDSPVAEDSVAVGNILDVMMKYTTECAIVYEPDYDNFEDLFKSCYLGNRCKNLGESACDYLNESLSLVLGNLMASDASVGFYELDFFADGGEGLLKISDGNCSGDVSAAQRKIISGSESLVIRMKVCEV